jgi:hypothetical protein
MPFFKNGEQAGKKVLFGGWYQWEGEDIQKGWRSLNVVEIIMCSRMKMKK